MSDFLYKVIDTSGNSCSGTIEAPSEAQALERLEKKGYVTLSITEKKSKDVIKAQFAIFKKSVKQKELAILTRQLAALLKAGIPILEALETTGADIENQKLKSALREITRDIQDGATLSQAMSRHRDLFSEAYIQTVVAGETGGILPTALSRLAEMIENSIEIKNAVKSAIRYPLFVIGVLAVGFLILVTFVLPRLAELFARFRTALPLPTRIMLGLNQFFRHFWPFIIFSIVFILIGVKIYISTQKGRYVWDRFKIDMPILGLLNTRILMSRFCDMTTVMLDAGVPILKVIEIVRSAIGNSYIAEEFQNLRDSLQNGNTMASYLYRSKAFPKLVTRMVKTGESSGRLEELLQTVSSHYQSEVRYSIKNLTSMIEPTLTIIIGFIILFFGLSVFLPIWNTIKFLK